MNLLAAALPKRLVVSTGIFLALIAGLYLRLFDLGIAGGLFILQWPLSISLVFLLVSVFLVIADRIKDWRS
jgi:hypothetical protein